jgi:hypothetical protein
MVSFTILIISLLTISISTPNQLSSMYDPHPSQSDHHNTMTPLFTELAISASTYGLMRTLLNKKLQ